MVIIGNFLNVSPEQSRNIVGAPLLKRVAETMPSDWRLVLCTASPDAWQEALQGSRCELVRIGNSRLARKRWYEAVYTQLVFPFHAWRLRASLVFSPSPIFPIALGRKNIVMIHDIAYRRIPQEASLPARLYMRTMYRAAALWARLILTVSRFSASEIASVYHVSKDRLAVLPNSLVPVTRVASDTAKSIAHRLAGDNPYFLYVGITRYRKNLPRLIEAFKEVLAKMPGAKLVLAGKRDTRFLDVAAVAREKGVAESIVQTGFITEEERSALYQGAAAVVIPSLYEGFGLQAIEAQELGAPVVASNSSSFPEVGGNSVLYVDPLDSHDIARGMLEVASSAELRSSLAAKGAENLKRFAAGMNADIFLAILLRAAKL